MNRKLKVCMIGATAVGKTSLVGRYVRSTFSEVYRTTIGVKIETRQVRHGDETVELVLWDLSGEDEFQNVQASYLRGSSGYLLVIDGTRPETIDVAASLSERVAAAIGRVPFVVVANKRDMTADWKVGPKELAAMEARGWLVVETSAMTGAGVERAFDELVAAVLRGMPWR